jgi:fatty acid desaturase
VAIPVGERDPYQPYRQQMLTPGRVKALSQLRPRRVIGDVALAWLTIAGAWALAAWARSPIVTVLACVVVGTRYYALFIIGHDGLHRRLFANRMTNDRFCDWFVLGPIGAVTRLNNRNHLSHHRHLATDADPDRHKHACFNKADLAEFLGYLSGFTSIVRSVRHVFFASGRRPSDEGRDEGYTLGDAVGLILIQLSLIGGLTWAFGWWGWPLMWALPVYCFTYLGDSIRSFAEHSHPEADAIADTHRLITYISNPVERMFFAPMHMNFHAAHHLWTSIPYYNLPAADREMRRHPLAAELEWRRSYLGYLLRYAMALPLAECRIKV